MSSQGAVTREENFVMHFNYLNAGIDGVHHPMNNHEIGATRAAALADDGVASYADPTKQAEHDKEMERAKEVNRKRVADGKYPMPVRLALKDGAESADYRPMNPSGLPPGLGPSALDNLNWRDVQNIADMLRAREEGTAGPHDGPRGKVQPGGPGGLGGPGGPGQPGAPDALIEGKDDPHPSAHHAPAVTAHGHAEHGAHESGGKGGKGK